MRRIAIITVIVAMLLCPFVSVIDSVDSDNENFNIGYISEGVCLWIYDGNDTIEYDEPAKFVIPNNAITMWALKKNNDDIPILLNGLEYNEGEHISLVGSKINYFFQLETICIVSFVLNNELEDNSIFKDWKKCSSTYIKEVEKPSTEIITMPTNVGCVESHKAITHWLDSSGNVCESIDCNTSKNVEVYPVIGERLYSVNFYKELDAKPETMWLSHISYSVPIVNDDFFAGWYYKDVDGNEFKFKEGVELQDNMSVYAKYYEAPQQSAQTSEPDESAEDVNIYTLLTENGISITDNPIVESIVASMIFVTLALVTFTLVFRRH